MQPQVRVAVTVTFLRMERPPAEPARFLPADTSLMHLPRCSLSFYRYLYDTVGGPHLWWLRRAMPDDKLGALLRQPGIEIHVLYKDGEPAGFFELDRRQHPVVNLGYFGLLPRTVGQGLGTAFLRAAIDHAWVGGSRTVTVNTCTADHQRALPAYLRAGFRPLRTVREIWDIPTRLGLRIPDHLRG